MVFRTPVNSMLSRGPLGDFLQGQYPERTGLAPGPNANALTASRAMQSIGTALRATPTATNINRPVLNPGSGVQLAPTISTCAAMGQPRSVYTQPSPRTATQLAPAQSTFGVRGLPGYVRPQANPRVVTPLAPTESTRAAGSRPQPGSAAPVARTQHVSPAPVHSRAQQLPGSPHRVLPSLNPVLMQPLHPVQGHVFNKCSVWCSSVWLAPHMCL